ncbi:MAG: V-type ATP synthase subunit A, partial [Thiobacillaceae bacterium]
MGKILEINGPLVKLELPQTMIGEQVRVGRLRLVGEVIAREGDTALAQLYENTQGLRPGETAEGLGYPLSVELGPGLLGTIFDGIQRPLHAVRALSGDYIARGIEVAALPRDKRWPFVPNPQLLNTQLQGGEILGTVQETPSIEHRILAPPDAAGELVDLASPGEYRVEDIIAHLRMADGTMRELQLFHRWPVRTPRPYRGRNHAVEPLLTGQRIL